MTKPGVREDWLSQQVRRGRDRGGVCGGEEPVCRGGRGGGEGPVVFPTDRAGQDLVVTSPSSLLLHWRLELVPGVLSAGGRGGQTVVGELQVLPRQGVLVELQQAGDEAGPGGTGLGLVHPAGLDDAPQSPGTVLGSAHPVAVLDQLQQSLQGGDVPVGSVAPGDDLPQEDTVGPDVRLNTRLITRLDWELLVSYHGRADSVKQTLRAHPFHREFSITNFSKMLIIRTSLSPSPSPWLYL